MSLLTIILPPAGVAVSKGIGQDFVINILLTYNNQYIYVSSMNDLNSRIANANVIYKS